MLGFMPYELPTIFAQPEDDGPNDAARDLIRLQSEDMTKAFVYERLASSMRPLGGGEVQPIPSEWWEIDEPLSRFATGAFDPERWADPDAAPTHRILVGAESFDQWLAALPELGPLTARQIEMVTEPKLRAARAVSRQAQPVPEPADQQAPSDGRDLAGVGPPLISIEAVCEMTGMATSTVYKRIDDDGFPQQIKLGSRSLWDKDEVAAWLREKAALRGN
ncbi:hypothetical protein AAW00_06395 [Aurantiacibacter luteus]|uniref:AlpA family transcriptional regulator n=2 Tax=Aurantiacibacter luteus TaxID=1581420 RepID=A0A0G9MZG0_9SPHN|nr:hypothetical protein AAW00_06395 [Aurantiacibacter luteus]